MAHPVAEIEFGNGPPDSSLIGAGVFGAHPPGHRCQHQRKLGVLIIYDRRMIGTP